VYVNLEHTKQMK